MHDRDNGPQQDRQPYPGRFQVSVGTVDSSVKQVIFAGQKGMTPVYCMGQSPKWCVSNLGISELQAPQHTESIAIGHKKFRGALAGYPSIFWNLFEHL